MIGARRPHHRVARRDRARLTLRAADAQHAAPRDHQKQDVVGGAVLVQARMWLEIHCLDHGARREGEWQTMNPLRERLQMGNRLQTLARQRDWHPIETGMPTWNLAFHVRTE